MKAPVTVYDIETIPLSAARLDAMELEFKANGTLKDPAKIAADIADKAAAWRDKAALSPMTGRVAMVGFLSGGRPVQTGTASTCKSVGRIEIRADSTDDELDCEEISLLEMFWELSVRAIRAGDLMVSFNGHGFDIPFLIRRSWALKVAIPHEINIFSKWGMEHPWCDLMKMFQAGDRSDMFTSLDTVAKFFGLGEKEGDCKLLAYQLQHEPEKAIAYLNQDLKLTAMIAERMGVSGKRDWTPAAAAVTNSPLKTEPAPGEAKIPTGADGAPLY